MTVANLKIAGREYVVIPKKEYQSLLQRHAKAARLSRISREDRADIALARKRLSDPRENPIPYEQIRKELGLA